MVIPIEKSFASHPKSKFWSKLNTIKPEESYISSNIKRWFDCNKCSHPFEKNLHHVLKDSWCPYCTNQKLCNKDENCKECFEKSFASHDKHKYWSNKNKLQPRHIFKSTTKKFWFNCNYCNHNFEKQLGHISLQNSWCPYCCKNSIVLCENKECKQCFEKSFASNKRSKFWSDKNKLQPRQVFNRSNKKFLFNCDKCLHIYETSLDCVDSWCQYCANKKLCESEDCKDCFNKSFASNTRSNFWSDKNEIKPRQVLKKSGKKFIFNCDKCKNEFESVIKNVNNKSWCPYCKNKTELKLLNWLKEKQFKIKGQVIFEWAKNKRYDFLLEDYKIIIELDGEQHFKQVSNWSSPEHNKKNDELKSKLALENAYKMIRICQQIVFYEKEDWENQLYNIINKVIKSNEISIHKIGAIYN